MIMQQEIPVEHIEEWEELWGDFRNSEEFKVATYSEVFPAFMDWVTKNYKAPVKRES